MIVDRNIIDNIVVISIIIAIIITFLGLNYVFFNVLNNDQRTTDFCKEKGFDQKVWNATQILCLDRFQQKDSQFFKIETDFWGNVHEIYNLPLYYNLTQGNRSLK